MNLLQLASHPAISAPYAMQAFAAARDNERAAIIRRLDLHPGMVIADIQAAGGYLSDGIYAALAGDVTCLCVEPVDELRQRLAPYHHAIADSVECFSSIEDNSVDAVVGLAGLHHSTSHRATLQECYRILKPGGQLVMCDVIEGSPVARWLNEFVNHYNPDGHQGAFLSPGKVSDLMQVAGFTQVNEAIESVPWILPDWSALVAFFRGLFALQASDAVIEAGVQEYLCCRTCSDEVLIEWDLLYFSGSK